MPNNLIDLEELKDLSEEERKYAIEILKEFSVKGTSEKLNNLINSDYKEIPVDIITFIKDKKYLGNAWHSPDGTCKLYEYWEEKLKQLFPDPYTTSYNNFIESGARGLGKSEIAVTVGLYLMHRIMCLKDPRMFFNLKPTENIAFAFMNITLSLSEDIGITKFQATVKESPWFVQRGTMTRRNNMPYWVPPEPINIIIGSQSSHVIGQSIYFCLDGDTIISTEFGDKKIKDLIDCNIRVKSIDNSGNTVLSDVCTVKETAESYDEYEIELEDGSVIKCTPNHRFMLKDGSYKEAKDLTCDDDLFDVNPYGYIYKTTNNINGKVYIGQKKSSTYLQEKYLGSGKLIKKAINKYGRDNFSNELLCWCISQNELNLYEKYYINLYNSTNKSIGYNIADGAQGGNLGDRVNAKISKSLMGHITSIETRNKIRKSNTGKKLSIETKKKISNANKGKVISDVTKQRMSESAKLVDRSSFKSNSGKICITNGTEIRYIQKDEIIPDNWYIGNCKTSGKHDMSKYYSNNELRKLRSLSLSGVNNPMFGKGYKLLGGKNGKALKDYWYNNMYFDCRKSLVCYLKTIDNNISVNLIRNIENNSCTAKAIEKYGWLIKSLNWRFKNEN